MELVIIYNFFIKWFDDAMRMTKYQHLQMDVPYTPVASELTPGYCRP
jgi:hypothetical protein